MADDHLLLVSAYADGELSADDRRLAEEVLAASAEARSFLDDVTALRRAYRYEEASDHPDVVATVLAGLPRRRTTPAWLSVAAIFLVGAIAGAAFVGLTGRSSRSPAEASMVDRILEAQHEVDTVRANLVIREWGWHPDVPLRIYTGSIRYEAPERLALVLSDETAYPTAKWVRNDTTFVVDDEVAWSSGPAGCPMEAQPTCTPPQPRIELVTERGPFPDAAPAPLDLVVPVSSFAGSQPEVIGAQNVAGVPAVGLRLTAAQADPLISGFLAAGNWRLLHPTDVVELWLSDAALVPVAMRVTASADPERALWAVRHGYTEHSGDVLLEIEWSDLAVNQGRVGSLPDRPGAGSAASDGFIDRPIDPIGIGHLPEGMVLHRRGAAGPVHTMAWSDGRAWLRVSWTSQWVGGRLFGDLGTPVRRVDSANGVIYVGDGGRRLALHADDLDVVVTGSLPPDELLAVAAGLGVGGRPVPEEWPEAGTATVAEAANALDGALLVADAAQYGPPAISISGGVVTMSHTGPGSISFTVVAAMGDLPPPVTGDVAGITVRRLPGRWTPAAGTIEWVEGGVVFTLRSSTLSLPQLLEIGEGMSPP